MNEKDITVVEVLEMVRNLTLSIQDQVNEFNDVTRLLVEDITVTSQYTLDGKGVSIIHLGISVPS